VADHKTGDVKLGRPHIYSVDRQTRQIRELSPGLTPVCHPNGERLYFQRAGARFWSFKDSTERELMPGQHPFVPAISVSGEYLACKMSVEGDKDFGKIAILTKEGTFLALLDPKVQYLAESDLFWVKRPSPGQAKPK
jgi:hypothetical protein